MTNPSTIRRAEALGARARRLWNARTLSPGSWQGIVANELWHRAQLLRKA